MMGRPDDITKPSRINRRRKKSGRKPAPKTIGMAIDINHYHTQHVRKRLDIMNPSQRVHELRADGHHIKTHWETVDTSKAKHHVTSYVLLAGG